MTRADLISTAYDWALTLPVGSDEQACAAAWLVRAYWRLDDWGQA